MTTSAPKVLLIRLSSLGDVILSTAALSALSSSGAGEREIHWVISREYAGLLRGHPAIHQLWDFDRKQGLLGWLRLCEKLWGEGFAEVIDLHSTLRSRIARLYFLLRGVSSKADSARMRWRVLNKQRWRLQGYFIFRALWPKRWRPTPLVARFSILAGGSGLDRPNLEHLLRGDDATLPHRFLELAERPYLAVMPSSRWGGKKWSVRRYLAVILSFGMPVVVLGGKSDRESELLVKLLEQAGHLVVSGVGELGFSQVAAVLARSEGYLGNDTGLAHLAEAVGRPATMIFGPTVPEMGFGPWRDSSRSVRAPIWCSPCGKDGRLCFRVGNRFACLDRIAPADVVKSLESMTKDKARA